MKASELRINNWVYEGKRLVHIHDGFGIDHAHNFKPIPLTEEWLLKFGFVLNNKNIETHSKGYSIYNKEASLDIFIRVRPSEKYFHDFFSVFNHSMCNPIDLNFIRKVEYLHQLQNLYFALTGKELKTDTK